jgi:hypothetical protein
MAVMTDNTTQPRSRLNKWILGIAIAAFITIVAIAVLVFRPKSPEPIPTAPPLPTLANSANASPERKQFNLFFYNIGSLELAPHQTEQLLSQNRTERLKQIITTLIEATPDNLGNPIPRGTRLHEAYLDDQSTAYLDFSRELSDAHIGGTTAELLTIQAILQTIHANFSDQIQQVQILIEGQEVDTLAGHVDISTPFLLEPKTAGGR